MVSTGPWFQLSSLETLFKRNELEQEKDRGTTGGFLRALKKVVQGRKYRLLGFEVLAGCLCQVLLQGRTKTFQKKKKDPFSDSFLWHLSMTLSYIWSGRIGFFLLSLSLKTLSDGKFSCLTFSQWLIWSLALLVHSDTIVSICKTHPM